MAVDPHLEADHHAGRSVGDRHDLAAVDQTRREMPQQIDHMLASRLGDQRREAGADAGKRSDGSEKRIEGFGAHHPNEKPPGFFVHSKNKCLSE